MSPYAKEILKWLIATRKDVDMGITVKRSRTKPKDGRSWLFGEKFRRHNNIEDCPDFYLTNYLKRSV